jgi:lysine 6-dehydrogenase
MGTQKKITVLGAGMVGRAIVFDLCREFEVLSVDRDAARLEALARLGPVRTAAADCADPETVRALAKEADLVVGALPGFMGFEALRAVIDAGRNVVDISFFDEDPFALDGLAKKRGVTAVVDCGVAPGMSNAFLGHWCSRMKVDAFECLVGGLPVERSWPFQYKAPFSPADVLEEYTRPARFVENGLTVVKPALSEPEYVEFEGLGTLEAFNTDGLRTLIRTTAVPFMKEKTMRYPGHLDAIRVLSAAGFLDKIPVDAGDVRVRPIDLASALLFPMWKLRDDEPEITVMRLTVRGSRQGRPIKCVTELVDRFDPATGLSSMARTTGFTASAAARLVLDGALSDGGITPPERIGGNAACFNRLLTDLEDRGVHYRTTEQEEDSAAESGGDPGGEGWQLAHRKGKIS